MSAPHQRNAKSRFQFSLRLLLLAFTGFAIGFPIWYRWPYEESLRETLPDGTLAFTRTVIWQRQWGGGRLMHGDEVRVFPPGDVVVTSHYVHGKQHGPFTVRDAKGRQKVTGQYVDDLRDGRWTSEVTTVRPTLNGGVLRHAAETVRRTMTWHRGKLHGPFEIEYVGRRTLLLSFTDGKLTQMDGRPMHNRLFDLLENGLIDFEVVANELTKSTNADMVEVPLKDVLAYFQDLHAIPITVKVQRPGHGGLQRHGFVLGPDARHLAQWLVLRLPLRLDMGHDPRRCTGLARSYRRRGYQTDSWRLARACLERASRSSGRKHSAIRRADATCRSAGY
jgi:hypothetical protein